MGCVSFEPASTFPDGRIDKKSMKAAELAARQELAALSRALPPRRLAGGGRLLRHRAHASRASCVENEFAAERHHARGPRQAVGPADRRRARRSRTASPACKPDRAPVLPGGFAIMYAVFDELDLETMTVSEGGAAPRRALRPARPRACTATCARRRWRSSCAATTSTPRRPSACSELALRDLRRSSPGARSRGRPRPHAARLGRAARRDRPLDRARAVPQALGLRALERRHAGLLARGAGSGSRASCSRTAASSSKCRTPASRAATGSWCLRCASPRLILRSRTDARLPFLRVAGDAALSPRPAAVLARRQPALGRRARGRSAPVESGRHEARGQRPVRQESLGAKASPVRPPRAPRPGPSRRARGC